MYNTFAYFALVGWIPVAIVLFARLRPPVAATLTFLGAFLLLPATLAIDFPGLPPVNRHVVGGLAALIGYLLFVPRSSKSQLRIRWPLWIIAAHVIASVVSVLLNSDAIVRGPDYLPGMELYDSLGAAFTQLVTLGVPFYLGMKLIRNIDDLTTVLKVIAFFGLAYVLVVLWENRMSPQLHAQLYGVFPHSFAQHIRSGGFRPLGFTAHGLELALFMATAVVAAAGLARAHMRPFGLDARWLFALLLIGLILCRTLGALAYGLCFPALIFLARPALQVRAVAVLAAVVLLYPMARMAEVIPLDAIVSATSEISLDRSQSLEFRFMNEKPLLEKFAERPFFGWGGWGRNRVFDVETGKDVSVTDGYWIMQLGVYGLAGYASIFGLLLASAWLAARAWRSQDKGPPRIVLLTAVLMLMMRVVDFLPNSCPVPFTPFLAGALMSFTLPRKQAARRPATPAIAAVDRAGVIGLV